MKTVITFLILILLFTSCETSYKCEYKDVTTYYNFFDVEIDSIKYNKQDSIIKDSTSLSNIINFERKVSDFYYIKNNNSHNQDTIISKSEFNKHDSIKTLLFGKLELKSPLNNKFHFLVYKNVLSESNNSNTSTVNLYIVDKNCKKKDSINLFTIDYEWISKNIIISDINEEENTITQL